MREENWSTERRSILLKEIVHQMLLARLFFEELYDNYKKIGQVSFQKLEQWIGTETNKGSLWNLKENSHLIFRTNTTKLFYESVFDWTLGSIFHEGMKLKEDVYLLEVYQKEGKVFTDGTSIPEDVDKQELLEEYQITITKAQNSADEEMESLNYLFSRGMEQLQWLIQRNKDEGLIVRFLVGNEEIYNRVYGQGALIKLFEKIYERGLEEAYLKAGKNYREGGWYSEALALFDRALGINPQNEEILSEREEVQRIVDSL